MIVIFKSGPSTLFGWENNYGLKQFYCSKNKEFLTISRIYF